ncbi:hypothetical protein LOC71_07895 [Rhodopirellula sp. JC740]|uniref:Lipoprotein n=1 Tax=Rhodopirellula halodulae TaxID=2894198 RepID=A0ABS8NF71_9BACT|nr:hypothetical protein [Rhodopirellula sp. JC740]MCC9642192.1 hypothetical protein [Rhodopirellula sp. JC740]
MLQKHVALGDRVASQLRVNLNGVRKTNTEENMTATTDLPSFNASSLFLCCTLLLFGCASFQEDGFVIPHGTPIKHQEIPRELRMKLALPEGASVKRYGDDPEDASYRIEYADGTISIVRSDGSSGGGMM